MSGSDQSTFVLSAKSAAGISYITSPPSIVVSSTVPFFIADTVNPAGIIAIFVPSLYWDVSVALCPANTVGKFDFPHIVHVPSTKLCPFSVSISILFDLS